MKHLRVQFVLFFVLLAGSLGFLVWNSYRQLAREEHELWRAQAEKVYNQMQAAVSDFLTSEDARRWTDYRFYGTLSEGMYPKPPVGFSPISKPPSEDPRGLIGYFQIDPEGEFSTPYLPEKWPAEMDKQISGDGRRELFQRLDEIASSLKAGEEKKGVASKDAGFVELGSLKKSTADILDDLSGRDEKVTEAAKPDVAENEVKSDAYRAKNVYPNPIQEQAVQLEKRKMSASKSAAPAKQESFAVAGAPPPPSPAEDAPMGSLGAISAPVVPASPPASVARAQPSPKEEGQGGGPEKPSNAAEPAREGVVMPVSALADPFQARLVSGKYLIFYRKVWADHRQFLQGFAVELDKFYAWLMDQSFANSELPEFALARLELKGESLAQYGIVDLSVEGRSPFFQRSLGYPLNLFDWGVYAAYLPRIGTRWFLNALSAAVVLLTTIGLYLIYRTASAQVIYSQKRQDFVSAVTHELKTPLTSIRMYSEMLEDDWAKDETKRKEYYRQISKESGRLSRMIENVLQLARLEKKTYKLNLKKEIPTADFREICEELKRIAEHQGFTLDGKAAPDLPELTYDPEAIKQILLTLLDNSLKFGAEASDKSLEASLERDGNGTAWVWRDRGPGVPEADLEKIFENFYRVENEMTRKTQGTGIGLAMSRMLAESMGASIKAANREGGGLEVRLAFPSS